MENEKTILIVEDNHGIRKLFEYILEREGYTLRGAASAAECYAHLKESTPDLILMDNALPDGSGLEILKEISSEEKFKSTVKLLISGELTTKEDRKMGLNAGAVDYMLKPIRENDLLARVQLIFKVRELEKNRLETEKKLNEELKAKNEKLKEYQIKLEESELKHRLLFENAGSGIGYYSKDGITLDLNSIALKYLGGRKEDFVGRSVIDIFGEENGKEYLNRIRSAITSKEPMFYEDWVDLPTGRNCFYATYNSIIDQEANIIGVQIISSDITKMKSAEEELRKSEKRFKIASGLSSDYAYAYDVTDDKQFELDWLIGDFEKVTGYKIDESESLGGWKILIFEEDIDIVKERGEKLLSNETDISEFRIVRKDKQLIWVREYGMPVWDEEKKRVVKVYGASIDITESKENEKKLKEKYKEIEEFNKIMVGRENRMIELKREINELREKSGQEKRYNAPDEV